MLGPHISEVERGLFLASFTRALVPFMWALPSDVITSHRPHLLTSSRLRLRFQHMNVGDINIQSTAQAYSFPPVRVVSFWLTQSPDSKASSVSRMFLVTLLLGAQSTSRPGFLCVSILDPCLLSHQKGVKLSPSPGSVDQ